MTAGLAEPDVLPDGTVSLAAPSAVFGAALGSLLTDGLRTAAAAAGLATPAADADAATLATGMDALTSSAGHLTTQAASGLAGQTGAEVEARPLPTSVTLAQVGGVLVGQDLLRTKAIDTGVLVHPQADVPAAAALTPAASAAVLAPAPGASAVSAAVAGALPHPASALLQAGQQHLASLPTTVTPAGRVPIGLGPVVAPVVRPPVVTPVVPPVVGPVVTPVGPPVVTPVIPPISVVPVGGLPISVVPVVMQLPGTDPRLAVMRTAYAGAVDRFVRAGTATALPAAAGFDLDGARTALLANLHPVKTVAALATARVPAIAGLVRPDPVAPVMAGPVFTEAAYSALVDASHDAFVPGLDSIPQDSVTLVQTNPTFIAAYLAGLNSALGHELLWRGYPTDERGTYWHSFWGAAPDIGPLHLFSASLPDNVLEGTAPLLVLILRGRLLKRYPDSDIYAVLAGTDTDVPELDDGAKIVRPIFRDFVGPDMTLVGFPLTYDQVVGTGGGQGYWFVVAEHPGQPRFGLTDPDPAVVHPPLPTWDELSWADLGASAAAATYVPQAPPPMAPAGTSRQWAGSAADMAAITYQPAVRVAIRARDLLGSTP
jgi:hypothetical protein